MAPQLINTAQVPPALFSTIQAPSKATVQVDAAKIAGQQAATVAARTLLQNIKDNKEPNTAVASLPLLQVTSVFADAAKDNSSTKNQLTRFLGNGVTTAGVGQLASLMGPSYLQSTMIFYDPKFNPDKQVLGSMARDFGATISPRDMNPSRAAEIAAGINAEMNKPLKLASPINILEASDFQGGAAVVAAGAVSMEFKWAEKFEPERVSFKSEPKKLSYNVNGMKLTTTNPDALKQLTYTLPDNTKYTGAVVPSLDKAFAVVFIKGGSKADCQKIVEDISKRGFAKDAIQIRDPKPDSELTLKVPAFSIEGSKTDIIDIMKSSGVKAPFGDEADFSKLFPSASIGGIAITSFKQQSNFAIDVDGVKASAITVAVGGSRGISTPNDNKIEIDGPFIAMIIDRKTNTPLFMAMIGDPAKAQKVTQ